MEGKVRQKVVANLGRLEDLQAGAIDQMVTSLAKFSTRQWVVRQASQLRAVSAKQWGPAIVFRRLWEELRIESTLARCLSATEVESDFEEAVFAMVLNRLCDPASKLGVMDWMKTVYRPQWSGLALHHLYRALDFLAEHKDVIERELYSRSVSLFDLRVDLVLWDTTTTYFEGRQANGLAEFGFSKDKRPDRVQIMVGVLMSRDGFPIAHEVFPGDTAELETFREALRMVKERFNIGRVILVADRGMVSEDLLGEIERAGLEYIVGVKMRKLKAAREVLARAGRYHVVSDSLQVKEVTVEGVRYVVCLNPMERGRDGKVREEAVASLREKLAKGQTKQLIGNSAYRRYLRVSGSSVTIDERALKEDERYDGKYVLRTNTRLDPEEVASSYKSLWQVERAFRELKSGLDLRPVYHWTETRIRGHVMVCFLALVLEMALRRKLAAVSDGEVKYDRVLGDLGQLSAVEVKLDDKCYLARTELVGEADVAFRALGMRPPNHVIEMPCVGSDPEEECCGTSYPCTGNPNGAKG